MSFWTIFEMWISEFADKKKSKNQEGRCIFFKYLGHFHQRLSTPTFGSKVFQSEIVFFKDIFSKTKIGLAIFSFATLSRDFDTDFCLAVRKQYSLLSMTFTITRQEKNEPDFGISKHFEKFTWRKGWISVLLFHKNVVYNATSESILRLFPFL